MTEEEFAEATRMEACGHRVIFFGLLLAALGTAMRGFM